MATTHVLAECGEKIVAAIALKKLQSRFVGHLVVLILDFEILNPTWKFEVIKLF